MPTMPPLSTTFILELNLYWFLTTLLAACLCCGLVGYLVAYLRTNNRPTKYIILRDSDFANETPVDLRFGARFSSSDPQNHHVKAMLAQETTGRNARKVFHSCRNIPQCVLD